VTDGTMPDRIMLHIDGKQLPAADGATFPLHNPATGEHMGEVANAGAVDVDAAVAAGTRTPMIMLRHILPNTLSPLTVQATYICASAMIIEAILSFIGAGIPPTVPSWGNIMAEGRALWQVKPYIVFFPAIFLSVTVLAVNLLGDGLRDALDPRMAKEI